MTTQQLSPPALFVGTRRWPGHAERTNLERKATAFIAGGTLAISLGGALLMVLATRLL